MVKSIGAIMMAYICASLAANGWFGCHSPSVARRLAGSGGRDGRIALTFDDGPDEMYTGHLLDLLERYGVKATFFVVARKAEKHTDLIERMKEEGHVIGLHSLSHKSELLSFPWETHSEFEMSVSILDRLGVRPEYYRPPWGKFNLANHHCASRNGMRTVLWSVEAGDWKKSRSSGDILETLKSKCTGNDIVLLHDSGGARGAPLRTIEALELFIPLFIEKGTLFVTVEEGLRNEND